MRNVLTLSTPKYLFCYIYIERIKKPWDIGFILMLSGNITLVTPALKATLLDLQKGEEYNNLN